MDFQQKISIALCCEVGQSEEWFLGSIDERAIFNKGRIRNDTSAGCIAVSEFQI
jgi:hypothetical protein